MDHFGRPNTSAVGVASAKDGKDIADAVTQLNVSMPTIRNPQSNSMAIKPGITSTSGVQLKLFRWLQLLKLRASLEIQ